MAVRGGSVGAGTGAFDSRRSSKISISVSAPVQLEASVSATPRVRPVCHRLCPGTRKRPAWSQSLLGRWFIRAWARVGIAVPDQVCPPLRRQLPGPLVYPSAPTPVPDQTHEAGENSPQFPRFRRQSGHLRFPPHGHHLHLRLPLVRHPAALITMPILYNYYIHCFVRNW